MSASPKARRKAILDALGAYQKQGPISHDVSEMADLLTDESDRGVVVILESLLEDILLQRLMTAFVPLTDSQQKDLTRRGGGLLSGFDHRIRLGQALGIIDEDTVEMLQTVKVMRNACAHSRLNIDFRTPQLRDALALLFDDENGEAITKMEHAQTLRMLFIVSFVYLSEIIVASDAKAAQIKAQALMDSLLREARRAVAKQTASRKRRNKR